MAHGDYTGQNKATLARAAAEEQQFAANRMSMVHEVVAAAQQGTVDLYTAEDWDFWNAIKDGIQEEGVQEVTPDLIDQWQPVKFRASEDLEDVTVGVDRQFTLKAGQSYKAPRWVATHLNNQALVLH